MAKKQFTHRIAFGAWLNDFRSEPIKDESWPSIRLDEKITCDLEKMVTVLSSSGYTAIDLFGLVTNSDWPINIADAISETRLKQVNNLIDIVHAKGLKVIFGLGVYSWGFDTIIRADDTVRGTNPQAMCGSSRKSRDWMQQVIDFVEERLEIDGYHLEVADQGRCLCENCKKENNVEYFNRLNRETAEYIRSKWQNRLILVNTSGYLPWGDFVRSEDFQDVYDLGRAIDVLIDGGNHGTFIHEEKRSKVVGRLSCEYGTSGGFWIYPPQHWDRLRWFLPYVKRDSEHLRKLYDDGSRACELYLGPLRNPSTELNIVCNGLLLQDIDRDIFSLYEEAVDTLYKPKEGEAGRKLIKIFENAEDAFFENWTERRSNDVRVELSDGIDSLFAWSRDFPERAVPGELFLEPLLSKEPGLPVYLSVHMREKGRKKYKEQLEALFDEINRLEGCFRDEGRVSRIAQCIESVITDIDLIGTT